MLSLTRTGGQMLNTIRPTNPMIMIQQFMRILIYSDFGRVY